MHGWLMYGLNMLFSTILNKIYVNAGKILPEKYVGLNYWISLALSYQLEYNKSRPETSSNSESDSSTPVMLAKAKGQNTTHAGIRNSKI
jgi:hypothetical protein